MAVDLPYCSKQRVNILGWNCLAVHSEGCPLGNECLSPSGHGVPPCSQAYALDVSEVSQSPLSDRTQQVEHCRCTRMPIVLASQGSYRSWKTWKVMEFDNLDSRPGKSWNFGPGPGKSWNFMLANLYAAELPTQQSCLLFWIV